ncbi:MAG: glycine--tRNA ligase subunit beta, partial [Pseudomonadota bacterium]
APAASPARTEERRGPRTDAPEKAIEGFLRGAGVAREALEVRADKKGEVFFATLQHPGRPAAEIVAEVVAGVVESFPWPKSMRWGSGRLRWVRPLRRILSLLSDEAGAAVVPLEIDGIAAADLTEGHRFMAPGAFAVTSFDDYAAKLAAAHVVLDAAERAQRIEADAATLAFAQGLEVVPDPGLLAEVAGLVEWPVVLMGEIAERFRALPPEVLQTSMREHQKFFSVRDPGTGAITHYITVANRETADQGATILAGNSKVLAARLSDAAFFWENDLREARAGMGAWQARLSTVTFHAKLGSQADRAARIAALAEEVGPAVAARPGTGATAAGIAKADLVSEMVFEFPELQGTMGRYYALAAGHPAEIAEAAAEHYAPLGPTDAVPDGPVARAVALADKIDMLTGFWSIDEKPTGSGDPFALRRAALGVIRILLEGEIRLPLVDIFERAELLHDLAAQRRDYEEVARRAAALEADFGFFEIAERLRDEGLMREIARDLTFRFRPISRAPVDLLGFFADRLTVHLRGEGVRHDVISACFALGGQDDLVLLVRRVRALQAVLETEEGANLLAGYKRAANILAAEEKKDGVEYSLDPAPQLAEDDAERALFAALDEADAAIAPALEAEDFGAAMAAMAGLRAPIDRFFDEVLVNAENAIVRRNRLCLLHRIRTTLNRVAILSELEG